MVYLSFMGVYLREIWKQNTYRRDSNYLKVLYHYILFQTELKIKNLGRVSECRSLLMSSRSLQIRQHPLIKLCQLVCFYSIFSILFSLHTSPIGPQDIIDCSQGRFMAYWVCYKVVVSDKERVMLPLLKRPRPSFRIPFPLFLFPPFHSSSRRWADTVWGQF